GLAIRQSAWLGGGVPAREVIGKRDRPELFGLARLFVLTPVPFGRVQRLETLIGVVRRRRRLGRLGEERSRRGQQQREHDRANGRVGHVSHRDRSTVLIGNRE